MHLVQAMQATMTTRGKLRLKPPRKSKSKIRRAAAAAAKAGKRGVGQSLSLDLPLSQTCDHQVQSWEDQEPQPSRQKEAKEAGARGLLFGRREFFHRTSTSSRRRRPSCLAAARFMLEDEAKKPEFYSMSFEQSDRAFHIFS